MGVSSGPRNERFVTKCAVQEAATVAVAAAGVQTTAAPSAVAPFLNCTVPVGPAPLLAVAIVAVYVTLPPEGTEAGPVKVVCVCAKVIVIGLAADALPVKLLSPSYVATRLCEPPPN